MLFDTSSRNCFHVAQRTHHELRVDVAQPELLSEMNRQVTGVLVARCTVVHGVQLRHQRIITVSEYCHLLNVHVHLYVSFVCLCSSATRRLFP